MDDQTRDEAKQMGVDEGLAKEIYRTTELLKDLFDDSDLNANDLYYLVVAAAIRMAKLAGAPSDQLREKFESALKRTEGSLPS